MKKYDLYLRTYQLSQLEEVLTFIKEHQLYNLEKKQVCIIGAGLLIKKDLIQRTLGNDFNLVELIEFIVQAQGLYVYAKEYY